MFVYLLIAVCILWLIYEWRRMRPSNFPPGPLHLPLVGTALFMPKLHAHLQMEKWRQQYGPLVGLLLGRQPGIVVCEPNMVLHVLKRSEFQGRAFSERFKERSFNKRLGFLFNDGPQWTEQRRFTLRHMKDFGFGKTSAEDKMLEEISELTTEIRNKTVQVSGLFNLSSVNVLWSIMAGIRYDRDDPKLHRLLNHLTQQFREGNSIAAVIGELFPSLARILSKAFPTQLQVASALLQKFIREVIRDHETTLDEENPRDFIDAYLIEMHRRAHENSSFTEESLIVICMDFFSAGAESVGNSLGFALLYMVLHPEIQEKVHATLDAHIGRARRPSLQDAASLPYIEAVLMEVQRINTIAPLTLPHRATCDTELEGYFVPKNTMIVPSIWSLLQDKDHWGDPDRFRPERFLDSAGILVKDDWLIPFGIGKRMCPGEALARNTLFLFFSVLLQEFKVTLPPGHPKPSTMSLSGFTTAPQPFQVTFTPR